MPADPVLDVAQRFRLQAVRDATSASVGWWKTGTRPTPVAHKDREGMSKAKRDELKHGANPRLVDRLVTLEQQRTAGYGR